MALLEDVFKGNALTGIAIGLGAILLAPTVGQLPPAGGQGGHQRWHGGVPRARGTRPTGAQFRSIRLNYLSKAAIPKGPCAWRLLDAAPRIISGAFGYPDHAARAAGLWASFDHDR
jgi:hypothetical protein